MKTYRQLRTQVQRLRRRNKLRNRATSRTAAAAQPAAQLVAAQPGEFEVFSDQISRTGGLYQQCGSARQAGLLADHFAAVNQTTMRVWSPADEQLVYTVSPYDAMTARSAAIFSPPSDGAVQHGFVSDVARDLHWDVYEALDLGLDLLEDANYHAEMQDVINLASKLDPEYRYQGVDRTLLDRANDRLGFTGPLIAQFLVDLLEDVNWHSLSEELDEYFFGPREDRYPDLYSDDKLLQGLQSRRQQRNEKLNRGAGAKAGATTNQKEGSIMTQNRNYRRSSRPRRKAGRNARRRLTARVERARTRDNREARTEVQRSRAARTEARVNGRPAPRRAEARRATRPVNGRPSNRRPGLSRRPVSRRAARLQPSKAERRAERLNRRVASLSKLLHTAERELERSERQPARRPAARSARPAQQPSLRTRRARVAAIRARLDREASRRPARRPTRRQASQARNEVRRAARRSSDRRTAAAPRVIKRKLDGKLYVRQD